VNSLSASTLAAAAAAVAAVPIALLAARWPSRFTRGLERASFAGNALPGIVIALSLVFFAANYASFAYQSLALLVFAYVVRFLPQALAGVESSLAAVGPRVEEAARALGRGPLEASLTVTVPLIRSGILAGAALVFLSAMKELPATLLLRPIGFETLATEIWKFTSVGSYSRAALPALLLIALSAPIVYLLSSRPEPTGAEHG
jgi:iron(III) transport system permease protein